METRFGGFRDRVAVVTGASRGIGRRIADQLAAHGARTAYLDLTEPHADAALGPESHHRFIHCDVSNEASVEDAFADIEAVWGPASVLVNNAGLLRQAPVLDTSLAMWEQTISVNLTGAFLAARRALGGMRDAGYGRIVNLGSSAAKNGGSGGMAAYAASKAGLLCLTKSIASEHARDGITCNAVAPTLIDTDMIAGLSHLADRIPVGRLGRTNDVAFGVLFLASGDASYITGEVMDVNGGFLID